MKFELEPEYEIEIKKSAVDGDNEEEQFKKYFWDRMTNKTKMELGMAVDDDKNPVEDPVNTSDFFGSEDHSDILKEIDSWIGDGNGVHIEVDELLDEIELDDDQ